MSVDPTLLPPLAPAGMSSWSAAWTGVMAASGALVMVPLLRATRARQEAPLWRAAVAALALAGGALSAGREWQEDVAGARAVIQTRGGTQVYLRGASAACRWPGGVPQEVDTLTYGLVGVGQAKLLRRELGLWARALPPACPGWAQGELGRPR